MTTVLWFFFPSLFPAYITPLAAFLSLQTFHLPFSLPLPAICFVCLIPFSFFFPFSFFSIFFPSFFLSFSFSLSFFPSLLSSLAPLFFYSFFSLVLSFYIFFFFFQGKGPQARGPPEARGPMLKHLKHICWSASAVYPALLANPQVFCKLFKVLDRF